MPVAQLTLELEIHHAHSLKDRRQVVRSVRDTLRRGFNVSVAELDEALVWNRATLGIAALNRSSSYLEGQLQQAEVAARRACARFGAEIIDTYMELLSADIADRLSDRFAADQVTVPALSSSIDEVTSGLLAVPEPASDCPPNSAIVAVPEDRNA